MPVLLLTSSMLCREMIRLLAEPLNAVYRPGPAPRDVQSSQTGISIKIPVDVLSQTLDNVSDRYLIPHVAPFLTVLISKSAGFCYDLELTARAQSSARHSYAGMSLRVVQMPIFSDAVLGDIYVPQSDWNKFEPVAYEFRFDVLHSPRTDVARAIAA